MQGGSLSLSGTFDDNTAHNPLRGRWIVTDFMLTDAPILGQILSLGSLTGLVDTLRGEGIRFEKFSSDVTIAQNTVTLTEGLAKGSAVGIGIRGTIDYGRSQLDLSGNVIPAYSLNSILSEVPLVGQALAGGEGQGIVGVDFSVRGNAADPDVGVNPLSALTPGFLRKIFGIFESESVDP